MLLTTEALVVEKPAEKEPADHSHGHGHSHHGHSH
jgi:chaperonin GroEL